MSTTTTDSVVADRFMACATGHICDALEHVGILSPVLTDEIRPLTHSVKFAGPAATLKLARSRTVDESRRLNELLEERAKPGDILVIDAQGLMGSAVFGDRAGFVAKQARAAGVVINGGARDVDGLNELGLPVHGRGRALPASETRMQGVEINGDVIISGVLVKAGDWLVGDQSGVCVIPVELLERVVDLAEERQKIDDDSMEQLRAGARLIDVHRHFKDDDIEQIRRTE